MGLALAALILHEITPVWDHGGNQLYFSVADRMQAILDNTPLPENDHFWVFVASLLIGIFRQKHVPIDAPPMSAYELARYLIAKPWASISEEPQTGLRTYRFALFGRQLLQPA